MTQSHAAGDLVSIALGDDGVAQVRLNRPDRHNALNEAMFNALIAAGHALFEMRGLRCVVLAGEGPSFCAGLDLSMFESVLASGDLRLAERTHGSANRFQQVALQWRRLPVPVIAAVHGVCFGGGLQIAAGADLRVVAPDARLAVMELKWGIVPDMGHFALWRGVVGEDVLRDLTYRACEFSGAEAAGLGFVTHLDSAPLTRATALAGEVAARNPHAVRAAKALFARMSEAKGDDILLAESHEQHALIGSRNQREAVASGMERRPPKFVDP